MDRHTPEQRHKNMSAVKSKDSEIEILLRRALWSKGIRYRKKRSRRASVAVFCDSEFWHGYDWENKNAEIKSNRDFWIPKIERNIKRDKEVNKYLEEQGWTVIRFWGKDIKNDAEACADQIVRILEEKNNNDI